MGSLQKPRYDVGKNCRMMDGAGPAVWPNKETFLPLLNIVRIKNIVPVNDQVSELQLHAPSQ